MVNKTMFFAICEICGNVLDATQNVESYLQFIDAHSGHGEQHSITTLQSYTVLAMIDG